MKSAVAIAVVAGSLACSSVMAADMALKAQGSAPFTALLCLENVFRKNAAQLHPHQGHSQD